MTDTKAGMTLREHVDATLIIDQFIREHDGELTPEIEMLMRDHENATKEKVESIAWFVKNEKARIAGIDAMIDDLTKRKRAINSRVEWLTKTYLYDQLQRLGIKVGESIKGTLSTIRLQLNNPRLDGHDTITEDTLIEWKIDPKHEAFVRYIPERFELDAVKFLAAAKLDPTLLPEGVSIVRDESVRVA